MFRNILANVLERKNNYEIFLDAITCKTKSMKSPETLQRNYYRNACTCVKCYYSFRMQLVC